MGSPMAQSHLTLKGQSQDNSHFQFYISERSELGHMLLLNINRKSDMRNPMAPSHLTLGDFERSKSRSLAY